MKVIDTIFLLSSENRNTSLEGLRGLAVIMIFNVHFFSQFSQISYFTYGSPFLEKLFGTLHSGMAGVDIFFVLSGFLVWKILFREKRAYLPYLKGRIVRLMPTYILNTIIISLGSFSFARIFYDLIFLPQFLPGLRFYNYVSWSLAWEWLFYILLVLIAMLSGRNNKKGIALLVLLFGLHFLLSYYIKQNTVLVPDCFRFAGFILGCFLCEYHKKLQGAFFKILGQLSLPLLFFECYLWYQYTPLIKSHWLMTGAYYLSIDLTAFLLINTLVNFTGWVSKTLSFKPLRIMGQISYTFYLTHAIVIPALSYWGFREVHNVPEMLYLYVVTFLTTTVISAFLFYFVERSYFTADTKHAELQQVK